MTGLTFLLKFRLFFGTVKVPFFVTCLKTSKYILGIRGRFKTLTQAAKGPKGLSCFEKQTAKHFLKLKKFKNLGIPGKLYGDYFSFYNN